MIRLTEQDKTLIRSEWHEDEDMANLACTFIRKPCAIDWQYFCSMILDPQRSKWLINEKIVEIHEAEPKVWITDYGRQVLFNDPNFLNQSSEI